MITDTQVHLWESDRPDRPWPKGPRATAQRPVPLEPPEFLPMMDAAGVDRAVIVPPIWAGDGNESAIGFSAEHPDRLAVMGRFDLWHPDRSRLSSWREQPGMLGIRLSYASDRGDGWFDADESAWFWAGAERHGIPLMLFLKGRMHSDLGRLSEIAGRHPDLTLIIDHLGLRTPAPAGSASDSARMEAVFEGFCQVLALARHPNVYVKWSSLPFYAVEPYPFPRMAPYLRRALDAFGPQRTMWGSDITRLRAGYDQSIGHVRDTLDFLGDGDREWVLGRAAETALRWPSGP
ncbi:amidohydrolase [Streptomyces sp. NBC_00988]|uniref:amidohydrolase family protein n=1 Tax=Streptomyces sp. NBC_00988 TaxID=2903704 RepID=UPI003864BAF0|nr:amidohydrolase [Streptomyces sp. NBC_00988]